MFSPFAKEGYMNGFINVRTFALIYGIVFAVVGIAGFKSEADTPLPIDSD